MRSALTWGAERLRDVSSPSLDASLLLGHVLGKGRSWLIGHSDAVLDDGQWERFAQLIERRSVGEPVAYLRGFVEWFGMRIEVNRDVLVPRPETELLVERAVELIEERGLERVIDVGTGSGAIAVAVARSCTGVRVVATDVSECALRVARRNADRQGVADRVTLLMGHLIEPVRERPHLVLANLPYLSSAMMDEIDRDVRSEPPVALFAGDDGLDLYRELVGQLEGRGWLVPCLFEIDPRETEGMTRMIRERMTGADVRVATDYAGHERIVMVDFE